MPIDKHKALIKCPFFLRFARREKHIACEGLIPGSEIISIFKADWKRDKWVVSVCATHEYCERCMLARALAKKYENKDD